MSRKALTMEMVEEAFRAAHRKLDWIISREGDANGERLQLGYLLQLVDEELYEMRNPLNFRTIKGSSI